VTPSCVRTCLDPEAKTHTSRPSPETTGIGHDVVRGAGEAAPNHEEPHPVARQWALLLDAGVVFDVFVEKSF
jgi:hypothetical protein